MAVYSLNRYTAILITYKYEKATIKCANCSFNAIMGKHVLYYPDRNPAYRRPTDSDFNHLRSIGFHSYHQINQEQKKIAFYS